MNFEEALLEAGNLLHSGCCEKAYIMKHTSLPGKFYAAVDISIFKKNTFDKNTNNKYNTEIYLTLNKEPL